MADSTTLDKLWVIMPVFNEEASIEPVISEWCRTFSALGDCDCKVLIIDDGSTDQSLILIRRLMASRARIQLLSQANAGHGHTCIRGYKLAIENGADYVFQIDSDGQCDPKYFPQLWERRKKDRALFGYRRTRDDGFFRLVASRFVSVVTFLATGVWVRDANVPYRLMPVDRLKSFVAKIPADFGLSNILVSVELQKQSPIEWINIHFRDRYGGSPSVKPGSFGSQALKLYLNLRAWTRES